MGIRDYDLFVLSDHGQVRSYPFYEMFEQYPDQHFDLLFRAFYGGVKGTVPSGTMRAGETSKRSRRRKDHSWELLERHVQRTEQVMPSILGIRTVFRLLSRMATGKLTKENRLQRSDPQRRLQLVSTGPVAHICLADEPDPVPYENWLERFPKFLDVLAQHEGIGFTLCRSRSGGCMVGCRGNWMNLEDDAAIGRGCTATAAEALRRNRNELLTLANMDWSGDFIIFGYGRPDHRVISYSWERGSHAGPSPEEMTPFLMVPSRCAENWPELSGFDRVNLLTLPQLHDRLKELYCEQEVAQEKTVVA